MVAEAVGAEAVVRCCCCCCCCCCDWARASRRMWNHWASDGLGVGVVERGGVSGAGGIHY